MIIFTLPNFYELNRLNYSLSQYLKQHPEHFNFKDLVFENEEGAFPFFYWADNNLNNYHREKILNRQEIETDVIQQHLLINCANTLLSPTDYLDSKINNILQILETGSNRVLLSQPGLLEYLSLRFPAYYFVGSPAFILADPEKKYLDKLKLIRQNCFDLDNEYYKDIPKSKIDINIIQHCITCNRWDECCLTDQKNRLLFIEKSCIKECPNRTMKPLTTQEIIDLNHKGYQHFHLDMNGETAINKNFYKNLYLNIFIKSEYHQNAKGEINYD